LALELGTDPERRESIRRKILEANHLIFGDRDAIREFEGFLFNAVNAGRG